MDRTKHIDGNLTIKNKNGKTARDYLMDEEIRFGAVIQDGPNEEPQVTAAATQHRRKS
jgi:hypothetical protein